MLRRSLCVSGSEDDSDASRAEERDADHQMPSGAKCFFIFSSRFRQHRRTGGADHDDVQSHGGKAAWLSKDRFVKIMAFCHMLPGQSLQLAIYVGYLKRKVWAAFWLVSLSFCRAQS
jgi:hypothetical protein